uniref:ODAD1 central coiled coil region domain-containing protein n=1 Tax=Otus sunia TaxID=257818 RepID=A0A8C8BN50_9STRI
MVAVVQVNREYFLWLSVLTRVQNVGVAIILDYTFFFFSFFFLCVQIIELERKVVRQNQIAVKVKQANCSKHLQKQTEEREMHLNNVTVHFNTVLTRNNKLQEEIENLQIQKAVLDNFYMKLHKKLDQQMRRMNAAIEQSAQARKQRIDSLARISAMKEKHNKDTVHFNVEMQERKRVLAQKAQLKNFMLTKSRNHSELEEQAKEKRALKVAQRVKQRQSVSHEVAYRRLMELAEDGDIDRLVNGFIEREEKNFSCFSYVTKLSSEVNKIQQKIEELQVCSRIFMSPLAQLGKLTETTEETRRYEERCKKSSKVLGHLKSDMEDLCKEINCDATKITQQLGENKQIMELNLTRFSGLVEKTKELLLLESILRYTSADGSPPAEPFVNPLLGSTKQLQVTDQAQLCPLPPTLDGTTDTIDARECGRREGGAVAAQPANPQFPPWMPGRSPAVTYCPQPIPTSLPHPDGYIRWGV